MACDLTRFRTVERGVNFVDVRFFDRRAVDCRLDAVCFLFTVTHSIPKSPYKRKGFYGIVRFLRFFASV